MTTWGFTFVSQPPVYVREVENSYCCRCYACLWPTIPPSHWHRSLLAIEPVTNAAAARTITCAGCRRPLAP